VEKRVNDLMNRMTLQEKVAQMSQYVGIEHMKAAEKDMTVEEMKKSHAKGFYPDLHSTELIEMTKQGLIGSFLHVITSEEANRLQSYAVHRALKSLYLSALMPFMVPDSTEELPFILLPSDRLQPSNRNWLKKLLARLLLKCVPPVPIGHLLPM